MKAQEPRQTMRATVKAAASSKVKGDGRGMRSLTTTPRAPGLGVTTNAGRHATGERLANPGTHGKQGAHASGMNPGTGYNPKTGVSPYSPSRSMRPLPPVLSDQAKTSETAQRIITRPPSPFDNPYGSVNVPAPANPGERFSGDNATEGRTRWQGHSSASVHNGTSLTREEMAAIGYEPGDTKSTESIISGFPTRNSQKQSGMPGTNSNRKVSSLNLLRQK